MAIVRRWYHLKHVHPTFYVGGNVCIASDFQAGPHSYVGRGCCICPRVRIGAYTYLAHDVSIQGGDHMIHVPGTPMCFAGRPPMPATTIEDDVWVGHRAILLAGVTVGRGSVVAAGAVVTKNVPPYTIVGGVPARTIGERFANCRDREIHDDVLGRKPISGPLVRQRVPGVTGN